METADGRRSMVGLIASQDKGNGKFQDSPGGLKEEVYWKNSAHYLMTDS